MEEEERGGEGHTDQSKGGKASSMLPEQHGTLTGEHPSVPRWESSQPKMPTATCWRKVQPLVQRAPLHLYRLVLPYTGTHSPRQGQPGNGHGPDMPVY